MPLAGVYYAVGKIRPARVRDLVHQLSAAGLSAENDRGRNDESGKADRPDEDRIFCI